MLISSKTVVNIVKVSNFRFLDCVLLAANELERKIGLRLIAS